MRRSSLFWGLVIVLVGIALLVNNLFPGINVQLYIWPGVLILLGVWFLLSPAFQRGSPEVESLSLPMEDIQSAEIRFQHGAGKLTLGAGSRPAVLVEGEFAGGVKPELVRTGASASLRLRSKVWNDGPVISPAPGISGLNWNVGLTRDIPLQLRFETGACEAILDLSDLKVTDVRLQTGASRTELTLPARAGATTLKVESGMAEVVINVPQGVAARIKVSSGMAGIKVAERFPQQGGFYLSPDFDSAENKVEIAIDTGMGSVTIR